MATIDDELQRWIGAGIIDPPTAERIRVFEASREQPAGLRWQALLALILGALLLAAGVALFVVAHWDELSPLARFTVVMGVLIVLHGVALLARPRFSQLATVLHGVGTLAAGAAIALVGQIFSLQEHWPADILLWALCALAGWALLGDQVQQTITLLLVPAWIICEWVANTQDYQDSEVYIVCMVTMFAAAYLVAFLGEKKKLVFGVLFAAGCIGVMVGMVFLIETPSLFRHRSQEPVLPTMLLVFAWICTIVLPLLFAWRFNPPSVLPVTAILLLLLATIGLRYLYDQDPGFFWGTQPSQAPYVLVAPVAAFLAWWGVGQRSRAIINYGGVCFALAVLWFYFSNVMDKLERSFSLIGLGVLFLGGGWLLEKTRRRLVLRVKEKA